MLRGGLDSSGPCGSLYHLWPRLIIGTVKRQALGRGCLVRPEVTDRGCATSPSCSGTLRASRRVGTRVAHLHAVISGPRLSFPLCVSAWGVHAGPCSPTFSWAVSGLGSLAEAFSSLPVPGLEPFIPSFLRVSSSADTGHLCLLVSTCPLKPLAAAHTRVRLCVCLGAALFSICSCSFQSFDPFVLVPDSGGPCVLHSRPCVLRSLGHSLWSVSCSWTAVTMPEPAGEVAGGGAPCELAPGGPRLVWLGQRCLLPRHLLEL